ncbi:MAG: hypothetical protein HQK79_08465 [Desulfobacterales bacterium]|nr:hypothetical protein [Desulfobacterales bacterium]
MSKKIDSYQYFYRILDVDVCLRSEKIELFNLFMDDYDWFRTKYLSNENILDFSITSYNGKDELVVLPYNDIYDISAHPSPNNYIYQIILRELFDKFKDFFVLHAGVVSIDENVLAISGSQGIGKTTFILELLKNNCIFFSDDFCPIHKATKLVYPFPRNLWIKNKNKKNPIRIKELSSAISDIPQKLKWLICLKEINNKNDFCHIEVILKDEDNCFIQELYKIGYITINNSFNENFPLLSISYPKGRGITLKIKELLKKHKDNIWNFYRIDRNAPPDFLKEAELKAMSTNDAAFFLLHELKSKVSLDNIDIKPMSVFMKLFEILEGIQCYSLNVGKIESMRKLVLSLINGKMEV